MADSTYIKPEPYIKPDPEAVTASPLDDDDLYEDAGDLEFFDQYSDQGSFGQAYLARVPKDLWEAWDSLPDDAEIEVGTMRQWDVVRPDGSVEVCRNARYDEAGQVN
ncbi:transcription initiation factor IIF [Colletotrichum higginsianum]|nr:transcription initiation factor IIF [Colletotrichum higginsianum]